MASSLSSVGRGQSQIRPGRGRPSRRPYLRVEPLEPRSLPSTGFFADFGPADDPVQTGYRKLGLDPYSSTIGHGLEDATGASLVDRGPGAGTAINPSLTRDFLTGTDNTFRVDKPNTRPDGDVTPDMYSLTVYLGDQAVAHSGMRIYLQGVEQSPTSGVTTQAGQFVTRTYTVGVYRAGTYANQVSLRLTGEGAEGYALDGFSLTAVGDATVAVSYADVQAAGLQFFPDSGMGVLKNPPVEGLPPTYTFFGAAAANDRPETLRTVGALDNLLGFDLPPEQQSRTFATISGINFRPDEFNYNTFNYVAINAADPVDGNLLLGFVTLERDGPFGHRVYGSTGLAKSTDRGQTWTFLGEIITPAVPYDSWWATGGAVYVAAEGGQYTIASPDGSAGRPYLYAYTYDFTGLGFNYMRPVTVSRARLDDVIRAALAGSVTGPGGQELWYKYSGGNWDSPAASRLASIPSAPADELVPVPKCDCPNEDNSRINYVSVNRNTWLQKYVLISLECATPFTSTVNWRISDDGVHWSDRQVLAVLNNVPDNYGGFFYATAFGLGDDTRQSDTSLAFTYTWWSADRLDLRYTAVRVITFDTLEADNSAARLAAEASAVNGEPSGSATAVSTSGLDGSPANAQPDPANDTRVALEADGNWRRPQSAQDSFLAPLERLAPSDELVFPFLWDDSVIELPAQSTRQALACR